MDYNHAMRWFEFWRKWMLVVFVAQAAFGLFLAIFGPHFVLGAYYDQYIDALFGRPDIPPQFTFFHRWVYALLGSTIASWSVAMAFIAYYPYAKREKWAWSCIFLSVLVWFPLDTSASAAFKVWPNVIFNASALIAIAIPLLATRKAFTGSRS